VGAGDMGQLGRGPDNLEQDDPEKVIISDSLFPAADDMNVVEVRAGGIHTVCVTRSGSVSKQQQ